MLRKYDFLNTFGERVKRKAFQRLAPSALLKDRIRRTVIAFEFNGIALIVGAWLYVFEQNTPAAKAMAEDLRK